LSAEGRDESRGRQVHGQVEGVLAAGAEAYDEEEEWEEGCPMIRSYILWEMSKEGDRAWSLTDAHTEASRGSGEEKRLGWVAMLSAAKHAAEVNGRGT